MGRFKLKTIYSLLLVFLMSLVNALSTQAQLFKDCRIYEEFYDGISCRNASTEDVPICNDGEDIVSSPRRLKLCCCTRLREEEITEEESGDELSSKFCKFFEACQEINTSRKISKENKCPSGFASTTKDLENLDSVEGVSPPKGKITCCCSRISGEELFAEETHCRFLGCNDPVNIKGSTSSTVLECANGLPLTRVSVNSNNPATGVGATELCCCSGEPNLGGLTCKLYASCQDHPISSTGPIEECPENTLLTGLTFDLGEDGTVDRERNCCCSITKNVLP